MSKALAAPAFVATANLETIRIRAGRGAGQYWKDLISYREVLFFMAWRDVLVRYKQAAFGIAWALLRPLLTVAVFSIVFGRLGKFPSDGMPYPLLVFCGLLPWLFFAGASADASNSLLANQNLVSKVYFPRLHVPLAAVLASIVDFLFATLILFAMMAWYHVFPTWRLLSLPLFFAVAVLASCAIGVWFSALNVKYRDFRFILPVLIQVGMYASPVAFTARVVPPQWETLYWMNPMVGVIQGFRWAVFGEIVEFHWLPFLFSLALVVLLLVGGLLHFRSTEKTMADFL
jgi:lipopolysaccharide transport system permease protein